jgi:hypothetical protein
MRAIFGLLARGSEEAELNGERPGAEGGGTVRRCGRGSGRLCSSWRVAPRGVSAPRGSLWLQLAVMVGLCSRRVVKWAAAYRLSESLAHEALQRGLAERHVGMGLLDHTDPGKPVHQRELPEAVAGARAHGQLDPGGHVL